MAGAGGVPVGFIHNKAARKDKLQTLENCAITVQNLDGE